MVTNEYKIDTSLHIKLMCEEQFEYVNIQISTIEARKLEPLNYFIRVKHKIEKEEIILYRTKSVNSSQPKWKENFKYTFLSNILNEEITFELYHGIF
jgi:hypothetical protein